MTLRLFNTKTRKLEEVRPHSGSPLKLYTCGPTVYNFAHIGNFRSYVAEDLLKRTLLFFKIQVHHVMNITDLDDKTIGGATKEGISLSAFTAPFRKAFLEDVQALHILPADHYPNATDYIPQMITYIETLLEKGHAYKGGNGSIYYSIRSFPSYGALSHFSLSDLKENASGENDADEYEKENISDFVLWKLYDPCRDGSIFWESPFGRGRPGWHIECTVMSIELLGPTLDIHCGGVDNMFPHHENEIAQSEGCTGCTFSHHWMHVEHLLSHNKKMSKSLGNFYTLRDLFSLGYTGREVRYILLSTHYRTQLNFTLEGMAAARASLERIAAFVHRLHSLPKTPATGQAGHLCRTSKASFAEALSQDLNISSALATLFDLVREVNTLCDQERLAFADGEEILHLLALWDTVLAFLPLEKEEAIPAELLHLLEQREQARKAKEYQKSDTLRDAILAAGYAIEDTPQGPRLRKDRSRRE